MGLWDLYQQFENSVTGFLEGWKGYIAVGSVILLLLIIIVSMIIVSFNADKPDAMSSKTEFSNSAKKYCTSNGFNSWEWKNPENETDFHFICKNEDVNAKNLSVNDYYVKD